MLYFIVVFLSYSLFLFRFVVAAYPSLYKHIGAYLYSYPECQANFSLFSVQDE